MSKSIEDLREALFATLQGVKDGSIDIDRARTVNELGKTLCETAKVEVEYLRANGGGESSFLESAVGNDNLPPGVTSVTRHRLR